MNLVDFCVNSTQSEYLEYTRQIEVEHRGRLLENSTSPILLFQYYRDYVFLYSLSKKELNYRFIVFVYNNCPQKLDELLMSLSLLSDKDEIYERIIKWSYTLFTLKHFNNK